MSMTVIVIRSLVPGGTADRDRRLFPGDRLVYVRTYTEWFILSTTAVVCTCVDMGNFFPTHCPLFSLRKKSFNFPRALITVPFRLSLTLNTAYACSKCILNSMHLRFR